MPKTSKILEEKLISDAKQALIKIGNEGTVALRLKAIIASSKHGIILYEIYHV